VKEALIHILVGAESLSVNHW